MARRARPMHAVLLLAGGLAAIATPVTAAADIAVPAPHHTCHARDVAAPGETCTDCSTDYDHQERCLLEHVAQGRERRCIFRDRGTIDEVWCDSTGAAKPPASSTSAA